MKNSLTKATLFPPKKKNKKKYATFDRYLFQASVASKNLAV
jgi:hypothetical protein